LILTAEGKILDGEHAKRLAARIAQLHQGIKCGCPLLRFGIDNLDWEQQHEVVSCGGQPSSGCAPPRRYSVQDIVPAGMAQQCRFGMGR
jgi:hypothetical protein